MIKVPFRAVLISLVALVAIGGLVVPNLQVAGDSGATEDGACTHKGTTLFVDFGSNSKMEPLVRCITDTGLTGWQVLEHAGLKVLGTAEYPDAFVCRIDSFPSEENEDCNGTPGLSTGSWVYFYANTGTKGWSRSPVGAATRKPRCGEVEGWLFVNQLADEQKFASPRINPMPFICR